MHSVEGQIASSESNAEQLLNDWLDALNRHLAAGISLGEVEAALVTLNGSFWAETVGPTELPRRLRMLADDLEQTPVVNG